LTQADSNNPASTSEARPEDRDLEKLLDGEEGRMAGGASFADLILKLDMRKRKGAF
jgi:hypothetical protein